MAKLIKFIPLLAIVLLTPLFVSYVYSVSDNATRQEPVHIEAADPVTAPSATVFGRAIGGISPGDLFYIDATGYPGDVTAHLYLTNTNELIHYFRYVILKVGIYTENSTGKWEPALWCNGESLPDTFITLRNSPVSFTLAGSANYKVTIDDGSFYCINSTVSEDSLSPRFYLTAE